MKTAGGALCIISTRYAPRTEWIRLAIVMLIFCLLSFCTGVFELYLPLKVFFLYRLLRLCFAGWHLFGLLSILLHFLNQQRMIIATYLLRKKWTGVPCSKLIITDKIRNKKYTAIQLLTLIQVGIFELQLLFKTCIDRSEFVFERCRQIPGAARGRFFWEVNCQFSK